MSSSNDNLPGANAAGTPIVAASSRRIWAYWHARRGDAAAPTWADFELMDIGPDCPSLQICDVLADGPEMDFRYRFVGTEIVRSRHRMARPDFTGLRFHEVEYQYDFSEIRVLMIGAAETLRPVHWIKDFEARDARGIQERLILPLVDASGAIDKLVIYQTRLSQMEKAQRELNSSF